ncbi:hypothetical protein PYCC9005_001003 [Savitreella phatthalungensis]
MSTLRTKLSNSIKIPTIGYGCYQVTGQQAIDTFTTACEVGYRHFDSASFYRNESEVGQAITNFIKKDNGSTGVAREDFYYTTKAWKDEQGSKMGKTIDAALDKCGLGYIDLMLLHWPADTKEIRQESWRHLTRAVKEGKLKSAGVSNYSPEQIQEIYDLDTGVEPVVNQIEISPWKQDRRVIEYCEKQGIILEAYCPLARARNMEDSALVRMADKYKVSPAQVLVRWSVQRGFVPLPKSADKDRMSKNLDIDGFELEKDDMELLNSFSK